MQGTSIGDVAVSWTIPGQKSTNLFCTLRQQGQSIHMTDINVKAQTLWLWPNNLTLADREIDCTKILTQQFAKGRLHQLVFITTRRLNVIPYTLCRRVLKRSTLTIFNSKMVAIVGELGILRFRPCPALGSIWHA